MVEIRNDGQVTSLSVDEWEERVRAGRIPPDTEVRFRPVTGAAFRRAGELEMYRSLYDERALASQRLLADAPPPWMTALLVGAQVRIWWLAQVSEDAQSLTRHLVRWTPPQLEEGEAWRLLTSGFLHLDLLHAAMNLLWLGYVGWNLERALGARTLLILYVASVTGGSLLSTFTTPASPSLGASGGVFGLIAAAVALGVLRPHALPERTRQYLGLALLPYLLVMFFLGFTQGGVDNGAHFGGLLTGGLLGALLDLRTMERRSGWNRDVTGGALGVMVTLTALVVAFGPRIEPLDRAARLRANIQAIQSEDAAKEPPPDPELEWLAPAGWTNDLKHRGQLAFASPSERSRWRVEQVIPDVPAPATRLATWWAGQVGVTPTAAPEGDANHATLIVEEEGKVWRIDVEVRGRRALVATWETTPALVERLAPLHARLRAGIVWTEPAAATAARKLVDPEARPGDAAARLDGAEALLDAGEVDAAVALARSARDKNPERAWALEVRAAGFYPDRLDAEAILRAALEADISTTVTAEVAVALQRLGRKAEALGVLELAWSRSPGDSALARQRTHVGLTNELDAEGRPWFLRGSNPLRSYERAEGGPEQLVWEMPADLPDRPAAPPAARPDLAAAAPIGEALLVRRAALARRAHAEVALGSPDLGRVLLLLAHDRVPMSFAAAVATLRAAVLNTTTPDPPLDPAQPAWPGLPWYGEDLPPLADLARVLQAHPLEALTGGAPPAGP